MKGKEKKVIFIIIGVLVAITLIVVIVTSVSKRSVQEKKGNVISNEVVKNEISDVQKEKYTKVLQDGTKINNSQDFNKAKKYKELEITNIQFTSNSSGNSVLLADVKNTGKKTHEPEVVKITLLGDDDKVIKTIVPVIGKIEPGMTEQLNVTITADMVNVKNFKIEENK